MVRRRSFGTVRQLRSGRWQVRYFAPDGGRITAPDTFATKGAADTYLAQIRADMARGQWIDPRTGEVSLREYAAAWIPARRVKGRPLSPRTLDTYQHSLDAWIVPFLGDVPLAKITPAVVRRWHAEVSSRTGPTATRQAYSLLRAVLTTAVTDEVLHRNPCRIRGAGQPTSPERPLIELEQVEQLAAAMPRHLQPLVLVAFWAHTRLGETLALQRKDVDLVRKTLQVERQTVEVDNIGPVTTQPKVDSKRTVHLPDPAVEVLRDHLARVGLGLPTAPLFTRPDGSLLRAHHVHHAWHKARLAVNLPDVHFHDLRHAGLTMSAQAGATLAEVMRRAGHVSTQAALRYQHAADRRDEEIARRLSEMARERRRPII